VAAPDFVEGVSLLPIMKDPSSLGRTAIAYGKGKRTIRTPTHRLILHGKGAVELFDHTTPEAETKNIAEANPDLVDRLTTLLNDRLPQVRD